MTIAWTEVMSSFTPAGTGWQDYNLFSNKSVPKGAIAYIVMAHTNTGAVRTLGLRTDGSALARTCILNKAGTGGACAVGMYIKCHASTGLIETYCDATSGVIFYLVGYWTGTDFIELATDITGTMSTWAWNTRDVYTNQAVPKGSVCSIVCLNQASAYVHMGVRTGGSALDRTLMLPTCSGGSSSAEATTYNVKSNATTGTIELFQGNSGTVKFLLSGFFAASMDYVELENVESWSSNWNDFDLTSYTDQDGRVIDIGITHYATSAAHTMGARKNGTSLSRYIAIRPSPDGYEGFVMPTATDTAGILELYHSPTGSGFFYAAGYYKDGTSGQTLSFTVTESINLADATGITKAISVVEGIGAEDLCPLSKSIDVAERLTVGEVLRVVKAIIAAEDVDASDTVWMVKTMLETEAVRASDAAVISKAIRFAETMRASDALVLSKAIRAADAITLADVTAIVKAFTVLETIRATDAASFVKALMTAESARLADAVVLVKLLDVLELVKASDTTTASRILSFVIADGLTLGDAVSLIKSLRTTDGAKASDAALLIKTIIVAQAIGAADKAVLQKALRANEDLELGDGAIVGKSVKLGDAVAISDAVTLQKAIAAQEPVLVADTVSMIKQLLASDGIRISETVLRSILGSLTELYASETIGIADATTLNKAIRVAQAIAASDTYKLVKAALLFERLGLDDDTKVTKALLRGDAIAVQDLARISKLIATSEGVTFDDEVRSDKSIVLEETITAGDLVALAKEILSREDIILEDGTRLTTVIMRALRIARLNAALKRGRGSGTTTSLEVEGEVGESKATGRKDGASIEGIKHEEELDG